MERVRQWCDRWDSTVGVIVGLVGVPGLMIAIIGFAIQYRELAEAELDTRQQFQLMQETIAELGRQTALEVDENTKEASDRFFAKRSDPLYSALFNKLEATEFDQKTAQEIQEIETSLSREFLHFQSTWQEVLNCKQPWCRSFDMLHRFHSQDICDVATEDAERLLEIIGRGSVGDTSIQVEERLRQTVLGEVLCLCPKGWETWGARAAPDCPRPPSVNPEN